MNIPMYPTDDELWLLAGAIDRQKKTLVDPSKPWRRTVDRAMGLFGERHVAQLLGLPYSPKRKPGGDRRHNLELPNGWPVDVVTRNRKGKMVPDLLLKVADAKASTGDKVMVLVLWRDFDVDSGTEPEVLGWAWESEVKACPILDETSGLTFPSHAMKADQLRPLRMLQEIVAIDDLVLV